jgi:O-antigen/teichoic acid export membrane protein
VRDFAVLEGEARASLIRNLLGIRLTLTLLGEVGVSLFALIAYGPQLGVGVLIAGLGVLLANTQITLAVPLMAHLRLGWVALLDFARQLVTTATIVVLVLVGARLLPFLAAAAVAGAVVLVLTVVLVRGESPLRPAFDLSAWRKLIGPVLMYSLAVAAGSLYFRAAVVLVSLIAGGRELGYYSVSFRVVEALAAIPALVIGAAFPIFARAARDDPARLGYALSRVFSVSVILGAWTALSLAVGARLGVQILGGAKFAPAAHLLAIQGIALGATFVSALWGYALLSLHEHRLILIFNLSMLALLIAVVATLVALDGAEGAAIGMVIVEVTGAVAGAAVLMRGRPHLRPGLAVVPKAAIAAVLAAAPVLVPGLPVIARLVISTLLYGALILALRAVPEEAFAIVPSRWRPGG